MTTLPCPSLDSISSPDIERTQSSSFAWLRKARRAILGAIKPTAASRPGRGAWTTAVRSVSELDKHMLDDIGAPRWLVNEVQRCQQARAEHIVEILCRQRGKGRY